MFGKGLCLAELPSLGVVWRKTLAKAVGCPLSISLLMASVVLHSQTAGLVRKELVNLSESTFWKAFTVCTMFTHIISSIWFCIEK